MTLKERYTNAVNSFVDKVKGDPNIAAVLVAGSLAYDTVWEKSDIDMTIVVRDQQLGVKGYALDEDGIVLNASIVTKTDFKRSLEKSTGGGFLHSYYARSSMVYTNDESLRAFLDDMRSMGADDAALYMFLCAGGVIDAMHKATKWVRVKNDPLYARFYLLRGSGAIADMVVAGHGESPNREAILRALELEPALMEKLYSELLTRPFTGAEVMERVGMMDAFLAERLELIARPALAYLGDGEIKTASMIARHMGRSAGEIVNAMDFLAEKGVIEKVTQTIRLTPKGRQNAEEIAYILINK